MRYESARFKSSIQIASQTLEICRAIKGHVIEARAIDGIQGVMLTVGAQRRFIPLSNVEWLDPGPLGTEAEAPQAAKPSRHRPDNA